MEAGNELHPRHRSSSSPFNRKICVALCPETYIHMVLCHGNYGLKKIWIEQLFVCFEGQNLSISFSEFAILSLPVYTDIRNQENG